MRTSAPYSKFLLIPTNLTQSELYDTFYRKGEKQFVRNLL